MTPPGDSGPPSIDDDRLFRELVDLTADSITVVDGEGRIVFANAALERLFGRRAGDRIGRPVLEFVHPDDRPRAEAALGRVVRGDTDLEDLEVRLWREDGSWRQMEIIGRRWLRDGRTLVLMNTRDVTDRSRAVAELARSNEMLTKTLRASRNIVSITRAGSGEFVEVNDEWLRVGGYARDEVIGRTANELGIWGDPENRDRLVADIRAGGGRLRDYEIVTYPRSGPREFVVNVETLDDEGGALILMIGTDVTDTRITEAQLRQAQKMEAVGQLTGGIAHDFNNLLGVVMGNAELLERLAGDRPELLRLVEPIVQASQRGATLTRQLLAFSRRQVLAPRPVDLEEVVARMMPLLKATLGPGIGVSLYAASGVWPVLVDVAQLEHSVLNLALNARDAMPEGGRLVLELRNRPQAEVVATPGLDLAAGDYVTLAVVDDGVGMAADTVSRVFDPFFTTKAPGQGTGLGLSMVFGFVEQSGGQVTVDSEPGVGTRVALWLPRSEALPESEASTAADLPPARGETVLVLDDEPDLLGVARTFLEQLGYRVVPARDEPEVQALLDDAVHFDLVLSDVLLTGSRRGPEVVADLLERRPGVPVIYMSGYPSQRYDGRSLAGARVPLLRKPFTASELAQRVRAALDG